MELLMLSRRRFLGATAAGAAIGLVSSCARGAPPNGQQRGFAMPTYEEHGYRDFDTAAALRELRGTGAGWVQIVPT